MTSTSDTRRRLVLFGDSVIDNGSYVESGEPDVPTQIQSVLPQLDVINRAVDGNLAADVNRDIQRWSPAPDDRYFLSAGGNDALESIGLLRDTGKRTFSESMIKLLEAREMFRVNYTRILERLDAARSIVATIYNPNFGGYDEEFQEPAMAALSAFNDVIQQEAGKRGFAILDLRELFIVKQDYANPIEPSAIGGAKIANAIAGWIRH